MSLTSEDIKTIVIGCKKRDRNSQKLLYNAFFTKMTAISFRYTGSYDDSKDITQDGFIQVFKKIDFYTGNGSLEGWIRRIVVNKSIDFLKAKKRLPITVTKESPDSHEYIADTDEDNLDDVYQYDFSYADILDAINQLKDEFRLVFNLSVVDGFSHKEISAALSITEELSRIRLKRARTTLQKILKERIKNK